MEAEKKKRKSGGAHEQKGRRNARRSPRAFATLGADVAAPAGPRGPGVLRGAARRLRRGAATGDGPGHPHRPRLHRGRARDRRPARDLHGRRGDLPAARRARAASRGVRLRRAAAPRDPAPPSRRRGALRVSRGAAPARGREPPVLRPHRAPRRGRSASRPPPRHARGDAERRPARVVQRVGAPGRPGARPRHGRRQRRPHAERRGPCVDDRARRRHARGLPRRPARRPHDPRGPLRDVRAADPRHRRPGGVVASRHL